LSVEEEGRLMPQLERFFETKAAALLALNTGMRRMEIVRLHRNQVNAEAHTVRYTAKGGKERLIPLNSTALAVVLELMKDATPDGYLFHRRTGHNLSASEGAF
jgi:integrase/recombinase XerD